MSVPWQPQTLKLDRYSFEHPYKFMFHILDQICMAFGKKVDVTGSTSEESHISCSPVKGGKGRLRITL